jgi:hypothetical protein
MNLCKGIKKNGTRCSRSIFNPTSNNEYCYQHRSDRYTYVAKDKVENINPVNEPPSTCQGKLLNGNKCSRKVNKCKQFCYQHDPTKKDKDKNEKEVKEKIECCICYEKNISKQDMMTCNHSVCKDCLEKMEDDRCPMCRQEMKGKLMTSSMIRKLKNKREKFARNQTNTFHQQIINDVQREENIMPTTTTAPISSLSNEELSYLIFLSFVEERFPNLIRR